jgi:gamma-glutamylcyclotransferase (GGCT)/AIG2-like uncharacterized protein YtfP
MQAHWKTMSSSSGLSSSFIFVYGTLKRGFLNHRVLNSSVLKGLYQTTSPFPLFVDAYCVPYCVDSPGTGHRISGEVYAVSPEVLEDLDELEGVADGRYARKRIELLPTTPEEQEGFPILEAWAYLLPEKEGLELQRRECLDDYPLELHAANYVPPGPERDPARRRSWGGFD